MSLPLKNLQLYTSIQNNIFWRPTALAFSKGHSILMFVFIFKWFSCSSSCVRRAVPNSLIYFIFQVRQENWKNTRVARSENMIIVFARARIKHPNKHANIGTLALHTQVNVHVGKFLSRCHTLLFRVLTGMQTHMHDFPLLASHHKHVIHLSRTRAHLHASTHLDLSRHGSPTMHSSRCGWNPSFPQHSCDHVLCIF